MNEEKSIADEMLDGLTQFAEDAEAFGKWFDANWGHLPNPNYRRVALAAWTAALGYRTKAVRANE